MKNSQIRTCLPLIILGASLAVSADLRADSKRATDADVTITASQSTSTPDKDVKPDNSRDEIAAAIADIRKSVTLSLGSFATYRELKKAFDLFSISDKDEAEGGSPPSPPNNGGAACSLYGVANYDTHTTFKPLWVCGAKGVFPTQVDRFGVITGNVYYQGTGGFNRWQGFTAKAETDGRVGNFKLLKNGNFYSTIVHRTSSGGVSVGAGCLSQQECNCIDSFGNYNQPGPNCNFTAIVWHNPDATPVALPKQQYTCTDSTGNPIPSYEISEAVSIGDTGVRVGGNRGSICGGSQFAVLELWNRSGPTSFQESTVTPQNLAAALPGECTSNVCANPSMTGMSGDGQHIVATFEKLPFCTAQLQQAYPEVCSPTGVYLCPPGHPSCKIESSVKLTLGSAYQYYPHQNLFPPPASELYTNGCSAGTPLYPCNPANIFPDIKMLGISHNGEVLVGYGRMAQLNNSPINLIPSMGYTFFYGGSPSGTFKLRGRVWTQPYSTPANATTTLLPQFSPANSLVEYIPRSVSQFGSVVVGQGYNGAVPDSPINSYRTAFRNPSLGGSLTTVPVKADLLSSRELNIDAHNSTGLKYFLHDATSIDLTGNFSVGNSFCYNSTGRADNFWYGWVANTSAAMAMPTPTPTPKPGSKKDKRNDLLTEIKDHSTADSANGSQSNKFIPNDVATCLGTIVTDLIACDINGDGVVNSVDLQIFTSVLIGIEQNPIYVSASDINGDGVVNGGDQQLFTDCYIAHGS